MLEELGGKQEMDLLQKTRERDRGRDFPLRPCFTVLHRQVTDFPPLGWRGGISQLWSSSVSSPSSPGSQRRPPRSPRPLRLPRPLPHHPKGSSRWSPEVWTADTVVSLKTSTASYLFCNCFVWYSCIVPYKNAYIYIFISAGVSKLIRWCGTWSLACSVQFCAAVECIIDGLQLWWSSLSDSTWIKSETLSGCYFY